MHSGESVTPPLVGAWYLTGPTASGKTSVGVELAELLNAEIVSLDSMTLYREMNVGTAKPTTEDRQRVPHHLIDVIDPNVDFSLAEYLRAAHRLADEIRSRGKRVLFVGGTPLYLKSLLRGLYSGPPPDWEFRNQVAEELRQVGVEALHARLQQVDPLSAARLHPHDLRRIVRALEVYKLTGQPVSHSQTHFDQPNPDAESRVFVMEWGRPQLHQRIEARVDAMFAADFVQEVRELRHRYGRLSRTASQAVGYREVIEYLAGQHSLPETIELVKNRTRQFARRQTTWFRSLVNCQRIGELQDRSACEIANWIMGSRTFS